MNENALICCPTLRPQVIILESLAWALAQKLLVEFCRPLISIFANASPNSLTLILAQHEEMV